jgi:hypothetical protein
MIKSFKYLVFALLLLITPAYAANYYFNLASGNDTTGDGTAGNPWKTIDKCTTSRSAGDECRGAKTAITTLSGTLTFTDGSTSVATSVDQTGTVAAGDVIGKNSGLEGWWQVASLTSTTITLTAQYWGLSGSGDAVTGYSIAPITATEEYDLNSSGSEGNLIKVSGGWDLAGGPTQDGLTYVSTAYNGIDANAKSYVEVSKFIFRPTTGNCMGGTGTNISFTDIFCVGGTSSNQYALNLHSYTTLTRCVGTGGVASTFVFLGPVVATDCYSFSSGNSSSDCGIEAGFSGVYENARVYNSYGNGFCFPIRSGNNHFNDPVSVKTRASSNFYFLGTGNNWFYNATASDAATYAVQVYTGDCFNNYFIESSLTAGSSGLFNNPVSFQSTLLPAAVIKPPGSDAIYYYYDGKIEHDSSSECRSGKCLKFTPTSATVPLAYKVGNVKIPSASSDLTLYIYLKDDSSFNGVVSFIVDRNGEFISITYKTPSTSWVQQSIVVGSSDLVANEYLDLYVIVSGTAGNIYVDDFSADQ